MVEKMCINQTSQKEWFLLENFSKWVWWLNFMHDLENHKIKLLYWFENYL